MQRGNMRTHTAANPPHRPHAFCRPKWGPRARTAAGFPKSQVATTITLVFAVFRVGPMVSACTSGSSFEIVGKPGDRCELAPASEFVVGRPVGWKNGSYAGSCGSGIGWCCAAATASAATSSTSALPKAIALRAVPAAHAVSSARLDFVPQREKMRRPSSLPPCHTAGQPANVLAA